MTIHANARWEVVAQQLAAHQGLVEMRSWVDRPLLVYKGLELAYRYPEPSERASDDVDIITDDVDALQAALLAHGYEPIQRAVPVDYTRHHHLIPLRRPGLPTLVEVHRSPRWLPGMAPPSTVDLIDDAVPSRIGIDGLLTLEPAAHAVCVAIHSWADRPFCRERDLVDLACLLEDDAIRTRAGELADRWGVGRIWRLYTNAMAAAAGEAPPRWAVRAVGGYPLPRRSATPRRDYLLAKLAPCFVDHPVAGRREILAKLRRDLQPAPGERWRDKLGRVARRVT